MRIRFGLARRCLAPLAAAVLGILLPACYDDIVVDPGDHPCAKCKSCEHCVSDGETARCEPREMVAKMRCESATRLKVLDSCGSVTEVRECSASADCMEPEKGEASCKLRGHWEEGDVCPGNWDAQSDCSACRNQWQGEDCEDCSGNWDAQSDCSACRNRWQGDDCELCSGNWDADSDCSDCRNRWEGNDCEVCPAHVDPSSDCSICAEHWTGHDCNVCKGHRDLATDCEACLPVWVDHDDECGTCARGLEPNALGTDCSESCGNGIATASEACDDGNDDDLDGCDTDCFITEFTVSTYDDGKQKPSVAAASDGAFVVVWMSSEQDGDGWGVYGQRFVAGGKPVGKEFRVAQNTAGDQTDPKVAMAADGRFVVVWSSSTAAGGLVARRFAADGKPAGDESALIDADGVTVTHPSIAAAPDGSYAIAGTTGTAIWTLMYTADGVVNGTFNAGDLDDPGASTAADGASLVMRGADALLAYVRERRYLVSADSFVYSDKVMLAPSGGGAEFYADTGGREGHDQRTPTLALTGTWPIAVAWLERNDGVDSLHAAFLNGISSTSTSLQLRDNLNSPDGAPAVAVIGEGTAACAWTESDQVLLDVGTSDGGFLLTPLRIGGAEPALARLPEGFVLAWAAGNEIRAQRYDVSLTPLGRSASQP